MFDIGFTEIVVIAVVSLVVVGPDRLPSLVRTILMYIRKIKSGFNNIRDEVERELDLDGIQKEIEGTKSDMSNVIGYDELQSSLNDLKKESENLRDLDVDGYEYADSQDKDYVSDEEIEADMANFDDAEHNHDPAQNSETGIESDPAPTTNKKVS